MLKKLSLAELAPYAEEAPAVPPQASSSHLPSSASSQEIEDALGYLDPDMSYQEWIRIGMALHHALGESGFGLWNSWSQRGAKYTDVQDLRTHWKSFKAASGRTVTIRTVFQMAQQAGFRSSRLDRPLSSGTLSTPEISASPEVEEESEDFTEEEEDDSTPYDVLKALTDADPLDPPSLVKSVYEGIEHRAMCSQPWFALGAAIALTGFMLRDRVSFGFLRTNFYVLAIGDSATGKGNAVRCLQDLGLELGLQKMMKARVGSVQGLEAHLARNRGYAFLIQDEAMHVIAAQKAKNLQSFESQIQRALLELFTVPPIYSGGLVKDGDAVELESPFLSLYQTCTPELYKILTPEDLSTGMLRRYLVFEGIPTFSRLEDVPETFPERLLSHIKALDQTRSGTLGKASFTPEAFERFQSFRKHVNDLSRTYSTHRGSSLIPTLVEHVKKLCLLGAEPPRWEINRPVLEWAIAVALESFKILWRLACGGIAENPWEAKVSKVHQIIQKTSSGAWIPSRTILRKTYWLRTKDLQEILERLQQTGKIETKPAEKNGFFVRSIPQKIER